MKKLIYLLIMFFSLLPLSSYAFPKVDLLPGMSDKLFIDEGHVNDIKLMKINDKFYFFNLGSQTGIYLDIYDSKMNHIKQTRIGDFSNQGVNIKYNDNREHFAVFWNVWSGQGSNLIKNIYYLFIDLDGNLLINRTELGSGVKIGNDNVDYNYGALLDYDSDGNYMVVWTGEKIIDNYTSKSCIFGQRINSDFTLNGSPFNLHPCNDNSRAFGKNVFNFHDKYFFYWSYVENVGEGENIKRIYHHYYRIVDSNFNPNNFSTTDGILLDENVLSEQYILAEMLADQNNAYFIIGDKSKNADGWTSFYKLVKFNFNTEQFSDIYDIGYTYIFDRDSIIANNKIYLLGNWVNWFKEPNEPWKLNSFLVIFDLATNKAKWTKLIDENSFNNHRIVLGDIKDGNINIYRTYQENQYIDPVYGYITSFPESLIYSSSKRPLIDIIDSKFIQTNTTDNELTAKLKGRILLQVESKGEAWYVDPVKQQRVYLGRPNDAFRIMREFGLGISEKDYNSFKSYGPKTLSGRILLRVEAFGEAYYINPVDLKMHYLGRPADAFNVMRNLGLGITNNDLSKISISQ